MNKDSKSLTILHVDSEAGWRGGEAQVLYLSKGLIRQGHVPIVCGVGYGALLTTAIREEVRVEALDEFTTSPKNLRPYSLRQILALRKAIFKLKPDILHAHTSCAHTLCMLASIRTRVPLIVSRRVDFRISPGYLSRWKYGSRVSMFIAISKKIEEVLRKNGIPPEKIRLVHSGIDSSRFRGISPDPAIRSEFGFRKDCLLVGNVARLTGHKDHRTLLKAAKIVCERVPQARFLIAGGGEERSNLEWMKDKLGLNEKVVFAGFRKDIPEIMASLDLFVMSSKMEGLGTTILDAMSASLAVAATNAGGIPEAVEDGKTGLLAPPKDPEKLAEAVIRLLQDPKLRREMGRAGAEKVEREFSSEAMLEGNLRVYREVLNV